MQRLVWAVMALIASFPASAQAADPDRDLSQYAHTAWRTQDGSLSGAPSAIAQTADGYVWIGTSSGLFRFDGIRFVPWAPRGAGPGMASMSVFSLLGGREGGLWIGTGSNLVLLKSDELQSYKNAVGRINAIVEDQHGSVWIARTRVSDDGGPICEVRGAELRCH